MKTISELKNIISNHELWLLSNGEKGSCADLREANLRGVDLVGANLEYADLRDTDLYRANLNGANLKYANLQDAYLRYTNLRDADLEGAVFNFSIQKGLLEDVAKIITKEENKLDTLNWHSYCGTYHSLAGWACQLNSKARELEDLYGTQIAGLLTLGIEAHSYFFRSREETIDWLKKGK